MVSRIAKNPIKIPVGVDVNIEGQQVTARGRFGELKKVVHSAIKIVKEQSELRLMPINSLQEANALAGTSRAILNNMVYGVHEGFKRKLVLVGVGYRAKSEGEALHLTVGFSHPITIEMMTGLFVETPSATEIVITGSDKSAVCQMAADIRAVRPPEPYKGKGIRYDDERVFHKEAKKK